MKERIDSLLKTYDTGAITIGTLGGHSALDVCRGAKKLGFKTLVVCQRGREKTYAKYYRARDGKGIVDDVILVDKFAEITSPDIVSQLQSRNTIFMHNRYFWVYCDFKEIEERFDVPIFGTRTMLKLEERDVPKNQYYLLEKAGIRFPKIFSSPEEIDRLVIVKVAEAARGYERAFFFANSPKEFKQRADELLRSGHVTEDALKKAVIEEYVVGVQTNFNYFYSPISDELEIMGTDTRRQTNLDGIIRLPVPQQLEVLKYVQVKYIENGHIACTTKESIIEKIFELGEKFVAVTKTEHPPGIIGPFALQTVITAGPPREEPVVFDVSLRIPGSPLTIFTPHTSYLYGESLSYGERIAMEIRLAIERNCLQLICT